MASQHTGPVSSILTGDVVERIKTLELFSRYRVESLRAGDNRSPLHGVSTDFLQHRQYFPGDNLRYLDWRVLAKTDRLVLRQYEELTGAEMALVLDTSGSMAHAGSGMSKLEFAVRCAAVLFYVMYLVDFGTFCGGRLRNSFAHNDFAIRSGPQNARR